jgi:hypothetical protein
MVHTIRFRVRFVSDLQRRGQSRLEQVRLEAGYVMYAQVRPWIMETTRGPVEVADLQGDDGILLAVPFAAFQFVNRDDLLSM